MAAAGDVYANAPYYAFTGKISWLTGTIKAALFGSGYTPATDLTEPFFSSITGEISGTGYTAGGQALTSLSATVTEANSWSLTAATTHAYVLGDVVKPSGGNGFLYQCVVAGTSGGSAPTWPTVVGTTVTDGTVTWECVGQSICVFTSAAPSWTSSTLTNVDYLVVYDNTTGVASTSPLINLQTFATAESDSSGTFTVTPDPVYGWFVAFPS